MSGHSETVRRALRLAVSSAAENGRTMRACAATLRKGGSVPFFAPGEAGAAAADALAADHEQFAADCRRELDGPGVAVEHAEGGEGLTALLVEFAAPHEGPMAQHVVLCNGGAPPSLEQLRKLLDPEGEYDSLEFGYSSQGLVAKLLVLP